MGHISIHTQTDSRTNYFNLCPNLRIEQECREREVDIIVVTIQSIFSIPQILYRILLLAHFSKIMGNSCCNNAEPSEVSRCRSIQEHNPKKQQSSSEIQHVSKLSRQYEEAECLNSKIQKRSPCQEGRAQASHLNSYISNKSHSEAGNTYLPSGIYPLPAGGASTFEDSKRVTHGSEIKVKNEVEIRLVDQNRGQIRWARNGKSYTGEISNLRPHGVGRMIWPNGDVYEGQWEKGIIQGRGRYQWANGDYYEGTYVNGIRSGFGNYVRGDIQYCGEWKDSKPNGHGQIYNPSRGVYQGQWKDGLPVVLQLSKNPSSHFTNPSRNRRMEIVQERVEDQ